MSLHGIRQYPIKICWQKSGLVALTDVMLDTNILNGAKHVGSRVFALSYIKY